VLNSRTKTEVPITVDAEYPRKYIPVTTNESPLNPSSPDMNPDIAPNEIPMGSLYLAKRGLGFVSARLEDRTLLYASMAIGMLRPIRTRPIRASRAAVEIRLEK
jgi:hypothetical protein